MSIHVKNNSTAVMAGTTTTTGIPEAITVTTAGITLDMRKFHEALMQVYVGADSSLDATHYWYLTLQHAHEDPDNANTPLTWENCADEDLVRAVAFDEQLAADDGGFALVDNTNEDEALFTVGYNGRRAYLRLRIVASSSAPGSTTFTAICLKAAATSIPTTA